MTTADGTVMGSTQIFGSAPRNRAFTIVLLAEGFTAAEQGAFNTAADKFVAALWATPPYDELSSAINVFRVNVSSTESGADDPASAGGTGATARTYFDATFGANGTRRLLVCNESTALTVANEQVPEYSLVLVVVNSMVYGGSGGSVGVYSLADSATEIAIHEAGHSAFGLADEYAYYADSNAPEPDHEHYPYAEPFEPNVTINGDRGTLKWGWAISTSTAIPTTSNPDCSLADGRSSPVPAGTVGLFEGAQYYHCGAYRPEFDCKMRALRAPFCQICRQIIRDRIGSLATLPARARTPISVVARYPEHLDVFAVADSGRTMTNWWDGSTGWTGWSYLYGGISSAGISSAGISSAGGSSAGGAGSPITSISRYSGHLDVFTVGADNRVASASWNSSSGWSSWVPLGDMVCRPGATVTAVSRYSDRIDLFTKASDGRMMSTSWDAGSGWADWFQVSRGVAANDSPVTAISRYRNHLDLFTVGTDGHVYSTWWDDRDVWFGWFRLGDLTCRPDSTVTAISRYPDHIDLFTTAADGKIMSTWWDTRGGWADWFHVSGGVASPGSPVTAISRFTNHLDLFTVSADNQICSTWWNDTHGWADWFTVSDGTGQPGGQVAAIQRVTDHLDLFTVGPDNLVYSTWWDIRGGWADWFQVCVDMGQPWSSDGSGRL